MRHPTLAWFAHAMLVGVLCLLPGVSSHGWGGVSSDGGWLGMADAHAPIHDDALPWFAEAQEADPSEGAEDAEVEAPGGSAALVPSGTLRVVALRLREPASFVAEAPQTLSASRRGRAHGARGPPLG